MMAKKAPSFGAGYGWLRVYGFGSGWARALRTVRREWPSRRAIALSARCGWAAPVVKHESPSSQGAPSGLARGTSRALHDD
jgi:hypothetical protein